MNTKFKHSFATIVFSCITYCGFAQGYIVSNGVQSDGFGTISVIQNPANGNITGFSLIQQTATTFQFSPFLDEGVRTFVVSPNDPISLQPILASSYPELTYPNTYVFGNHSQFYLGFYTGATFPHGGIYDNPLFGWGKFINNNGTIQLLDSALEYGGGGIYAGTQTIIPVTVPEPSVISVSLIAFGVLALRCQKMLS